MDPVTLAQIFEPFFTTKEPGRERDSTVDGVRHREAVGRHGARGQRGRARSSVYLPAVDAAEFAS